MDTGIELVIGKNLLQRIAVADVHIVERHFLNPNNLGHTSKPFGIGIAQIVHYHSGVAGIIKLYQSVGADISRAPGNKYVHLLRLNYN